MEQMRWVDFYKLSMDKKREKVKDEPLLITADGQEAFIALSLEKYHAHIQSLPGGRMVRIEGVLYREIK